MITELHPICAAFPAVPGLVNELALSIQKLGLLEPIVTYDGQVLDGRHRLEACEQVGVAPRFEPYDGDNPIQYALAKNLHRRHLTEGQKARAASRLANLEWGDNSWRDEGSADPSSKEQARITIEEVAAVLDVSPGTVNRVRQIERDGTPEDLARIDDGAPVNTVLNDIKKRRQRESRKTHEYVPLEGGPWQLILADPPWQYQGNTTTPSREIEEQYPTLPVSAIADLEVPVADDSVLYLWCTVPLLEYGLQVLEAWGFQYKSMLVWVKRIVPEQSATDWVGKGPAGLGYWARVDHEYVLVGTRGQAKPPDTDIRFSSVIAEPRRGHSQKPIVLYDMLERAYPQLSKVELFARQTREGWDSWGNEI